MTRKASKQEPVHDVVDPSAAAEATRAANAVALAAGQLRPKGGVLLLAGRIQALRFMSTVSNRAAAEAFVAVRKSKEFVGVPYTAADGTEGITESLDDYCKAFFGKSEKTCYEHASNLHVLGPELYQQSEQLGLNTKDYRAIRALPDDLQDQVKAAIESGDADAVGSMLQEMATRAGAATAKLAEARADANAKDRLIEKRGKEIDKLQMQLMRKFVPDPHSVADTEAEQAQYMALQEAHTETLAALARLTVVVRDIKAAASPSEAMELAADNAIRHACQRLVDIGNDNGLAIDLEELVTPAWLQAPDESAAQAKARAKRGA